VLLQVRVPWSEAFLLPCSSEDCNYLPALNPCSARNICGLSTFFIGH
jgi:hypothetical protein